MTPRSIKTNLIYNGVDANIHVSDVMTNFEYTDATEESDTISITVNDPDEKWLGAWMPVNGDKIQAELILENWDRVGVSKNIRCGEFVVDSFRISGPPPQLVIEGVSSPVNLDFKETKRTQTWEKITIRQIAAEISERYGLTLIYDTSQDVTLEREEQNEKTDSAYLKELCNKYGLGIKIYFSQIVIWSYDEYESKSASFTIQKDMVRKWEYKGSIQGTYTGAKVSYSDPAKDEIVEAFVGSEGRILTVNEKAESVADAERIGKNALRNANRKEITMDITMIPGTPVMAAETVQMSGLNRIDGAYFISKVSHRLSKNDYSLRLSLYRIADPGTGGDGLEAPSSAAGNYVVKSGDTLWGLAAAFYQDGTRYSEIYEANRETIEAEALRRGKKSSENGRWIYAGTELIIP